MHEVEEDVRIESHAKVYLHREISQDDWQVSIVTCDGYPLDGPDDGDYTSTDSVDSDEVANDLNQVALPDAETLLLILADALGYQVVRPG